MDALWLVLKIFIPNLQLTDQHERIAYGADVLLITSPNLPDLPLIDTDTSRGKRSTQIDLTTPSGREILSELSASADVFLQAYRPGGLSEKGFGPEQLAQAKPGIVYASLNAYGWDGPWKDRRGVDKFSLLYFWSFAKSYV